MIAEAIEDASAAFKKALIGRALSAELGHLLYGINNLEVHEAQLHHPKRESQRIAQSC